MTQPDGRLPLTIVTGFLGSGKTTLIRGLLAEPAFTNAAIIVNELGETGIDHHLFRQTDERITLLADGCACCARRDDLIVALVELLRQVDRGQPPAIDRVILETTGLANPAPIQHTLTADPLLSRRFRLDRVVTTLDAVAGAENLATFSEAVHQLAAADDVVITKADLAPDSVQPLAARAASLNPAATIHITEHGRIDTQQLMSGAALRLAPPDPNATMLSAQPQMTLHAPGGVASICLTFNAPLDWPMLGLWLTMLLHCHGARVLRVKGLLDVGEEGPLLLEGVQHVVHTPRHLAAWPHGDRQSRLIFIVRDLDPAHIRRSLDAFQATATT